MNTAGVLARARRLLDPQFVAAAGIAVVVEIGLSVSTVPRVARLLGVRIARGDEAEPFATMSDAHAAWVGRRHVEVNRILRWSPIADTCLRRALILGQRIRRLDPVLVIGVRHDDGVLAAHAWLVVAGVALDPLASRFAPLHGLVEGGE